jgi:hypothetical protein
MIEIKIEDLYEFKTCPLRYKLLNIDKVKTEKDKTVNDGFRESIQTTLNYFYIHLKENKLLSNEKLKQKFISIWNEKVDLYKINFDNYQTKKKKELEGVGLLNFFHRQQSYLADEVIDVNVDFRIPFENEVYIKGKIPLVRKTTRGNEIVNFKISEHAQDDFWVKTDMGLTLQSIGYHGIYGQPADSMCLHYLKTGTMVFTDRKKEEYQRLYKSIKMLIETYKQGWFFPRETYSCERCPVKEICINWY